MNWQLFFYASYELIISIIFGLISIFIILKLFNIIFLKLDLNKALKDNNIAVGILEGSIVVGMLLLIQSSVLPSVNTLRMMVMGMNQIRLIFILISFAYFLLFYVIAIVVSVLILMVTTKIYTVVTTKIDEIKEIKGNNIAVSIILSLVLPGMVIFIQPALQNLLSSVINYDQVRAVMEEPVSQTEEQPSSDTVEPPLKVLRE